MLRSEIVVHCPLQWSRIALYLLHSGFRLCPRSTLLGSRGSAGRSQNTVTTGHSQISDSRPQRPGALHGNIVLPLPSSFSLPLPRSPSNSRCKRPASQEFGKAQAKRIGLHWPLRSHVIGNSFPVGSVAAPPQHVSPMLAL